MLSTGLVAAATFGAVAAFAVDLAAPAVVVVLCVVAPPEWECDLSACAVPVAHANIKAPIPIVAAPIDKRRVMSAIVGIVNSAVLPN
ncbi:hypothetical protein [Mycolicibacterium mucogenicum]|jgi:hypothetical protein|uniref:hypothetical protein n=1 Tax=Mycolicibacterium mucogenicum TaxID=56689 RepID=UPI00226A2815|nr:hypothetical protein [Mycolicibacterium mucogenicum]